MIAALPEITVGAVGVWTGVAMGAAALFKQWNETRKLSAADRLALREGFTKQVGTLREENRELLEDQRKLREEYDHYRKICHSETDQLRSVVISLETRQSGMMRKLADIAIRMAKGESNPVMLDSILTLAAEANAMHDEPKA